MTLAEFMQTMNEFGTDHPECLDMIVITSGDAEGNTFDVISYTPCVGVFSQGLYSPGEFRWDDLPDDYVLKEREVEAVCVN
jgi:hypothetical protein